MNKISFVAIIISIVALVVSIFSIYEMKQSQKNFQYMAMQSQSSTRDKKDADPYLSKQVKNSIIKRFRDLQDCYNTYLEAKTPIKSGVVKLDWQIDQDGNSYENGVVRNDFHNENFGKCLSSKIKAIKFPPPPMGIPKYVEHSFAFKEETKPKPKKK